MRPEHAALLALADPDDAGAARALSRLRSDGARRRFTETALREGVAGHVWFELLRRRLTALVPEPAVRRLHDEYESCLRVNMLREMELHSALEALGNANLRCLPAGPAVLFSAGLVPNRGVRRLDLLTLEAHAPDVNVLCIALEKAGFRIERESDRDVRAVSARATPLCVERLAAPPPQGPSAAILRTAARLSGDPRAPLVTAVDRLYLSRHPAAANLAPAFADKRALARALAARAQTPGLAAHLRTLLFPPSDEMVRRHGVSAAGFGLYRLYAKRLLLLRRQPGTIDRGDADAK